MTKIKAIGFDMDYTLAVYKSPQYEELALRLIAEELVKSGYPEEILNYQYDPGFCARGLLFDNIYGNLLKIDSHGNILVASHGLKMLRQQEIGKCYENKFVNKEDNKRYYIYNTLFNLPEVYLMACVVDLFDSLNIRKNNESPMYKGSVELDDNLIITYKQLQKDVRSATNNVHCGVNLKKATISEPKKYIVRDDNLPILLDRMKDDGKKLFLATNSEYWYTEGVMTYLFDVPSANGKSWRDFFDVSIVDSRKPLFFEEGTLLRQIDTKKGTIKLGRHIGGLTGGQVYSGGSSAEVTNLIGCKGKEIMYIGDHIFGDILKSKKTLGWKTFLVIPELADEIHVWHDKRRSIATLKELDAKLCDMFSELDSSSKADSIPDITQLQKTLRWVVHDMEMAYGKHGSLFRSGRRNTMFAGQVVRFADLYSSSFINLLHYPLSFNFMAETQLLPHESNINDSAQPLTNDVSLEKLTLSEVHMPDIEDVKKEYEKIQNENVRRVGQNATKVHVPDVKESPMTTRSDNVDFWKRKDVMTCSVTSNASLTGSRPATPDYITHYDDDYSSEEEGNGSGDTETIDTDNGDEVIHKIV